MLFAKHTAQGVYVASRSIPFPTQSSSASVSGKYCQDRARLTPVGRRIPAACPGCEK